MYNFRSHNLLLLIGFLLGIGFVSHFIGERARHTQDDQLTEWLMTFADDKHRVLAGNILREAIQNDNDDLKSALERVSEVIASHPDIFNVPVDSEETSGQDVFKVLIKQWNMNQDTGGMSKGIQTERDRSAAKTSVESKLSNHWSISANKYFKAGAMFLVENVPGAKYIVSFVLRPLIDGLSINAP
jgi:hypothetical protein